VNALSMIHRKWRTIPTTDVAENVEAGWKMALLLEHEDALLPLG
jgi:hypothetical protein